MRLSPAPWLLLLSLALGYGACAPEPAVVPGHDNQAGSGSGGSAPTAGTTSTTAGTGSSSAGTTNASGGKGGSGTTTAGSGSSTPGEVVTGEGSGMALCGLAVGAAANAKIDDLEDGDNTVGNAIGDPEPPARVGYWFTYNEKTNNASSPCAQTPPPDPQGLLPFPPTPNPGNGSKLGAHMSGTQCSTDWGAGMGFDFNNCNMKSNPYDASAYSGITFWYKSTQPVRVLLTGNKNTAAGGCTGDCDNHHGKNFAASAAGATASITWAELSGTAQIGSPPADPQTFGTKRPFDPSQLLGFQVQVDQEGGKNFDVWIDDVSFL
jgi:hypothetical protein